MSDMVFVHEDGTVEILQPERVKLAPRLIPIDLSRGEGSEHPDIIAKTTYLVRVAGRFHAGCFSKQWYGWNFDGGVGVGQFDTPGYNASRWEAIWKIEE